MSDDFAYRPEVIDKWQETERLALDLMQNLRDLNSRWEEDAVSLYIRVATKAHLVEGHDPREIDQAVKSARESKFS